MARKKSVFDLPLDYIAEPLRPLAEPLERLKLDPRNAREHGDENIAAIVASLERFGQRKPVVCNRSSGYIEAGNGLLLAAQQLAWTHLAVVWVEDDPAAETGFALADNRTAELATWDNETLQTLLAELHGGDEGLYDALRFEQLSQSLEAALEEEGGGRRAEGGEEETDAGEDAPVETVPSQWNVVIECADQAEQQQIYEECCAAGRTCRLLTM